MNSKEHIKTIILILLVLMSIVLTYMVWNFSPDLSNADNTPENKRDNTKPISKPGTAKMDGTITPFQIIHSNGEKTEGMPATGHAISKIISPLKDKDIVSVQHLKRNHNLIIPELSDNFIVLDFTYDLPLSTYLSQVLDIDAKTPRHFNFNRLLIDQDHEGHVVLYAISKDRHQVVKMKTSVKGQDVNQSLTSLKSDMEKYTEIITNKETIDKATHIFAPKKPKDIKTYRMVFNIINVEKMNSVLFNDSTIVRSAQSGVTTYNNNTGVANYNDKSEKYHYRNLSEDEKSSTNMEDTIGGTFEFLNGHGGFLGEDYRLFSTDNMSGELTYQRFLNGYPTFNKQDLNEIQVTWGEKGVFDYRRSLLRTDVILNSGDKKSLESAESVRSGLANNSNIDFERVTNIAVGYDMDDRPNNDDIEVQRNSEFTPRWYVEYDGKWYAYKDGGLE
ncbi:MULTISPECIES: two-component system activity regulator YycH [Staphylococcus]|uniref:two-component system activity regulator YycH n=1 Tax=Staphylococcus TaxID=1279 RepID=UPI0002463495|nr:MULTISPECIES: two-component system activity regulator YycH [Staphylococcus]KAB7644683.1 hypothetical protein F9280_09305 [Staphylococcus sp. B2-b]MBN6853199.1 hypothetical protein [Staphylococcus warneri]MBX7840013.1 hypothetical protein [Staphylococcus warneri]MCF7593748.1 two-component system activity regulator YycH [Staphylococcus warneri]MCI2769941.1 two-component system activity regulator YycH [Staphylococcus warneri]